MIPTLVSHTSHLGKRLVLLAALTGLTAFLSSSVAGAKPPQGRPVIVMTQYECRELRNNKDGYSPNIAGGHCNVFHRNCGHQSKGARPPSMKHPNFFWTLARRIWINRGAINTGA